MIEKAAYNSTNSAARYPPVSKVKVVSAYFSLNSHRYTPEVDLHCRQHEGVWARLASFRKAQVMTYVGRELPQPTTIKKAVRWPVSIPIIVSGSGFGHHAAEIRDLSRTGCLIELQCAFANGDFVMITIPTFGPLGTVVAWSNGVETGLKFENALPLVVLEHITERHHREGSVDF